MTFSETVARFVTGQHNTSSVTDMMHTLRWPTLQEHRIKASLQMFHKIVNNKIEIPYENILVKSQSKTWSTHNQTFRQIQYNKDSYKFSFFCKIKDWNKLPENITKCVLRLFKVPIEKAEILVMNISWRRSWKPNT